MDIYTVYEDIRGHLKCVKLVKLSNWIDGSES